MTRINHIIALITLATLLVSTGCGDAGSFDATAGEDGAGSAGDAPLTLGEELELACEAYCDAAVSCRDALLRDDCADSCANEFGPEVGDACLTAQIEFLNCFSAASCDVSLRVECSDAARDLRSECDLGELGRGLEDDEVIEVIGVEGRERTELDGDAEETEPSEGTDDEEPGDSEDDGPSFDFPDFPDFPEIPEIGPVIEFS
ncbi:MAG: hypothetical protein ACN4G0_17405 [Polyangiales bacterium]